MAEAGRGRKERAPLGVERSANTGRGPRELPRSEVSSRGRAFLHAGDEGPHCVDGGARGVSVAISSTPVSSKFDRRRSGQDRPPGALWIDLRSAFRWVGREKNLWPPLRSVGDGVALELRGVFLALERRGGGGSSFRDFKADGGSRKSSVFWSATKPGHQPTDVAHRAAPSHRVRQLTLLTPLGALERRPALSVRGASEIRMWVTGSSHRRSCATRSLPREDRHRSHAPRGTERELHPPREWCGRSIIVNRSGHRGGGGRHHASPREPSRCALMPLPVCDLVLCAEILGRLVRPELRRRPVISRGFDPPPKEGDAREPVGLRGPLSKVDELHDERPRRVEMVADLGRER